MHNLTSKEQLQSKPSLPPALFLKVFLLWLKNFLFFFFSIIFFFRNHWQIQRYPRTRHLLLKRRHNETTLSYLCLYSQSNLALKLWFNNTVNRLFGNLVSKLKATAVIRKHYMGAESFH